MTGRCQITYLYRSVVSNISECFSVGGGRRGRSEVGWVGDRGGGEALRPFTSTRPIFLDIVSFTAMQWLLGGS